jgi:hypothetical protein
VFFGAFSAFLSIARESAHVKDRFSTICSFSPDFIVFVSGWFPDFSAGFLFFTLPSNLSSPTRPEAYR